MVEHHREEKSERESEHRGTETNAESQENKVDTETKEEQQEMKLEPDSGTRPGKPVQSGAHTIPPPSDSIQLMPPPSRAPPSNASSGQLMPPLSRAPPGNASSGQLMPPPPPPSRLKGKANDNPFVDPVMHIAGPRQVQYNQLNSVYLISIIQTLQLTPMLNKETHNNHSTPLCLVPGN